MQARNSQSFHGPMHYRFGYIWDGIKDMTFNAILLSLTPMLYIINKAGDTDSKPLFWVATFSSAIISAPFILSAVIVGGIAGFARGIFHALTRKPVGEEKMLAMQATLGQYLFPSNEPLMRAYRAAHAVENAIPDPRIAKAARVMQKLVARYSKEKSSYASTASLNIIRSIQGEAIVDEDILGASDKEMPSTSKLIREYLVANGPANNGKRLFNIFSELLGNDEDARIAEYRKNVTMMAQGKRSETSPFSGVPKELLLMIAERTVEPGYIDANRDLVQTYGPRLDGGIHRLAK